jgi:hypothetical protein
VHARFRFAERGSRTPGELFLKRRSFLYPLREYRLYAHHHRFRGHDGVGRGVSAMTSAPVCLGRCGGIGSESGAGGAIGGPMPLLACILMSPGAMSARRDPGRLASVLTLTVTNLPIGGINAIEPAAGSTCGSRATIPAEAERPTRPRLWRVYA